VRATVCKWRIETKLTALRKVSDAAGARFERVPIRLRLALAFAGVMILLFGLLALLLYTRFGAGLDAGISSSLQTRAADISAVAGESDQRLASHPVLPAGSGGFAQILAPGGRVLGSTSERSERPLLSASQFADAARQRVEVRGADHTQLLAYRVPGPSRNILVVGVSTADRDSALGSLQRLLFIGGPIALLIACAAGYIVAAKALEPVDQMRRRADRMVDSGLTARLPVPVARDEIRRLGQTLNEMLGKLQAVVERERAFVAGASHELRTPLTILQLELDDALGENRSRDDLEAAVVSAREEVRRLTSLAEDLLVIAQGDQQRLPIIAEWFEVRGAMRAIADRYSHLEELAGRRVLVAPGPKLFLKADLARLDQALSNMVNNALRFGEGDVVMRAGGHDDMITLHVLDDGPGFPPEFLGRAFERFSRAEPGRSGGGSGLGLSIVRTIAEAHDGAAYAENRTGRGAHVWLTVPAEARSEPEPGSELRESGEPARSRPATDVV
jgi:two-component system, OmpR family, sensor kinase